MRKFFFFLILGLTVATAALYLTVPGRRTDMPVLTWMTPDEVNTRAMVKAFAVWRKEQGLPPVDLRIDATNNEATKKLVQGLAGVGADLMDLYGFQMDLFAGTGMLADLTEDAKRMGFSPAATYPNVAGDFVINGRQYAFIRTAGVLMNWVNRDTFAKYGVPEPPSRWTMDEFEALGKRFVAAANPPGTRQRIYFTSSVPADQMRRGLGLANYNETGTFCTLGDPRNAQVLERVRRWTVDEKLIPTTAESEAMASEISGDGRVFSTFAAGRYGMIYSGQYAIFLLRPRGKIRLRAVEPAVDGFPNADLGSGTVGVYRHSKHRKEAEEFLQFMTTEPFNRVIVDSADSLPPVPKYTRLEEFLRPAGWENEWGSAEAFAKAAQEIGITMSKSPFVLQSVIYRTDQEVTQALLAGRYTAAGAAQEMANRINAEIQLSITRDPKMKKLYDERVAIQRQIDARRAAGQKVPAAWVTDAFHLAYYRAHGWLEEEPRP